MRRVSEIAPPGSGREGYESYVPATEKVSQRAQIHGTYIGRVARPLATGSEERSFEVRAKRTGARLSRGRFERGEELRERRDEILAGEVMKAKQDSTPRASGFPHIATHWTSTSAHKLREQRAIFPEL